MQKKAGFGKHAWRQAIDVQVTSWPAIRKRCAGRCCVSAQPNGSVSDQKV
jgi:hypothetical protein